MSAEKKANEKFDPLKSPTLKSWGEAPDATLLPEKNVIIECGWGRLVFAHTFESNTSIAEVLRDEKKGYRDLAIYLRDPHVVIAKAPQELFIDPSYTYRQWLEDWEPPEEKAKNYTVRKLDPEKDVEGINRIYRMRNMVTIDERFLKEVYKGRFITYWVAADNQTDQILGVAMGIDHKVAFDDPENGSSLWAVAVDPQAPHPGIGVALVNAISRHFKQKQRSFLDVSVLHDNKEAIALYEKLGFQQVPVFCVKNKNAINETLFAGPQPQEAKLNPYSMIIIDEARRRGIKLEVLDAVDNYFKLSYGGRSIICREALTELTSSIAMSRCSDKATTHRLLAGAGLRVPGQQELSAPAENQRFLRKYKSLVVKPAVGEQGAGITMEVTTKNELADAIEDARKVCEKVILEEMVKGKDLRVVVIDFEVVAAALRKPPVVIGDGKHTILELVKKQSRRRERATHGESRIPIDNELKRTVVNSGYIIDDVLPAETELMVRRTANLHTGGTIHDVTEFLHPQIAEAARQAARALDIPVVGLDFIVPDHEQSEYVIIEANERPGLANHEPQPTAQRFIDMLFPQSMTRNEDRKLD